MHSIVVELDYFDISLYAGKYLVWDSHHHDFIKGKKLSKEYSWCISKILEKVEWKVHLFREKNRIPDEKFGLNITMLKEVNHTLLDIVIIDTEWNVENKKDFCYI